MGSAISNAAACGACGQLQSSCYSSVLTSVILMGGCGILQAGQPCGDMILILPPMLMIMKPTVEDLADSGTKTKDFVGCVEMHMTCPSPGQMKWEENMGLVSLEQHWPVVSSWRWRWS